LDNLTSITTVEGKTYLVSRNLNSEGGQAKVFLLEDKKTVAKLYKRLTDGERKAQRDRLTKMIRMGQPSPAFVWAKEIIESPSLGYTMDFIEGYVKFQELAYTKYLQKVDTRTRLLICYKLVEAFEKLHLKTGYAYCDLSGNNILCEPTKGDVKIIDNDNLYVEGVVAPSTVTGTYRFMAPEIESGTVNHPNIETDLHSLAVLIFMTMLFHHPLLGDKVHDDQALEENALGKGAIYIYHPTDARNRYSKYEEFGGIPVTKLPHSIQKLFEDSFVKGLHNPNMRVRETNWKREIINQLDALVRCPNRNCFGKHTFFSRQPEKTVTCVWCGTRIENIELLKISNPQTGQILRYKVLYDGDWLAAHHCKLNQLFDFSGQNSCAQVEHDPSHGFTLRNKSPETFTYYKPGDAAPHPFPSGKRVLLKTGYRVLFGANGVMAEVI
jgi:serine/threonine protein kinase